MPTLARPKPTKRVLLWCLLTVGLLLFAPVVAEAAPAYQVASNFGGAIGTANGKFDGLTGIAVAPNNELYVADMFNNRIQVFNAYGGYLRKFATSSPVGVAVDTSGDVYVISDDDPAAIRRYSSTGTLEFTKTMAAYVYPVSIAVAPNGDIYVVVVDDSGSDIATYVERRDPNGFVLSTMRGEDSGNTSPYAVAVDSLGYAYVTDDEDDKVYKYHPTWNTLVASWGGHGTSWGKFDGASDVAIDSSGFVYVLDMFNNRVQRFTGTGATQAVFGYAGAGIGRTVNPLAMAVSRGGWVYVADNNETDAADPTYERIQRFVPVNVASSVNLWSTFGTWTYGSSTAVKLSGTVRNIAQKGVPGVPVYIQQKRPNGTWGWKGTAYTDWNGVYVFNFRPTSNGTYRAHFAANTFTASDSAAKTALVAPRVTLWFNRYHVYDGQTLTTNGQVAPGHAGKSVFLQAFNDQSKKWEWVGTAKLNSYSKFSVSEAIDVDGARFSVLLRLKFPGDSDHVAGYSATRRIYFN